MKASILAFIVAAAPSAAHAQGYVLLHNRSLPPHFGHAPIFMPDGSGPGAGFTAQLFLLDATGSLDPLFPTTVFYEQPERSHYLILQQVTVPGTIWERPVTVRMRVWETAAGSYEASLIRGESMDISTFASWDHAGPLIGLTSFTLTIIPEPSTCALLGFGALALYACARRKHYTSV